MIPGGSSLLGTVLFSELVGELDRDAVDFEDTGEREDSGE